MDEKKTSPAAKVEELKTLGNNAVKDAKYIEAVLHYTEAIKMDPTNYVLFSNRSFAFLKLDQHYLALQDANETVRLQPNWAKGYFRRAEVEAASGLIDEATITYSRALQLDPQNEKLIECIKKMADDRKKKDKFNENLIWICTIVGLILGIAVVVIDNATQNKPTLSHPIVMVLFSISLAGIGWAIGKAAEYILAAGEGKSLTPPEDLENKESNEEESTTPERKKYTKAQARHRYKQGKA